MNSEFILDVMTAEERKISTTCLIKLSSDLSSILQAAHLFTKVTDKLQD